jgi:hypothetical protein
MRLSVLALPADEMKEQKRRNLMAALSIRDQNEFEQEVLQAEGASPC